METTAAPVPVKAHKPGTQAVVGALLARSSHQHLAPVHGPVVTSNGAEKLPGQPGVSGKMILRRRPVRQPPVRPPVRHARPGPRLTGPRKNGSKQGPPHNPYKLDSNDRKKRIRLCERIVEHTEGYRERHSVAFSSCLAFSNYHWLRSPCGGHIAYFYCAVCALGFSELKFVRELASMGVQVPDARKAAQGCTAPTGLTAEVYDGYILKPLLDEMSHMYSSQPVPGLRESIDAEALWMWQQDGCAYHGPAPSLRQVRSLRWAPRSPDLNVVESAVGDLNNRLQAKAMCAYSELGDWEEELRIEWKAMSSDCAYRMGLFTAWEASVKACKDGQGYKLAN